MSKAFTNEESAEEIVVPPRAPLPEGVPNYVTPGGLEALRRERETLARDRARAEAGGDVASLGALSSRLAQLDERIAVAKLVDPRAQPEGEIRFGATVTVRDTQGVERAYRIVGVDEADAARGDIAFTSPFARALLGKSVGDVAEVRTPRGSSEIEIIGLRY